MELLIRKIKLIDNRSKDEAIRLELYGTLIPYLLSKEVFKNNIDLKDFIDSLKLQIQIKDYVYKSRTQVVARISREIEKSERDMLLYNVKVLKDHALGLEDQNNEKAKKDVVDMLNKYSRNK